MGPVDGSNNLRSHPVSNAFTGTVDLQSGTTDITVAEEDRKPKVHAIMMIVAWGLLLPLGVVFARFKEWGGVWFQLHRAVQVG